MPSKQPLSSKIVVTNRTALRRKYGTAGVAAIEQALALLIKADRRRGIATRLSYLDGPSRGKARVRDTSDPAENKAAIDAVVMKHRPEYLVILGSHDVVPYQDLKNPLHDPADPDSDEDRWAFGDLPYACETPYSQSIAKFVGPTRVVGRVPDLTGATSPAYLLAQLKAIAAAKPRPRPDSAFALSAKVWERSTKQSVRNILGAAPVVRISPTAGPSFARSVLSERIHFVNCHGDTNDHTFAGEGPTDQFETAMDSRKLLGVGAGTVAAFECCYGAELYDPAGLPAMSIANRYLSKGAVGVMASTTIAYGLDVGNANADVICQRFLEQLLLGASLGRALLEARLGYVSSQSVMDPFDEKTLAQFVLLGDPSLHPFDITNGPKPKPGLAAKSAAVAARAQRRVRLMKTGERLARECSYTAPVRTSPVAKRALGQRALASVRRRFKHLRLFAVREPVAAKKSAGKSLRDMSKATHVFVATRLRRVSAKGGAVRRYEGLVAYEVDGNIVETALVSR